MDLESDLHKGMVFLNHFCPPANNLESETVPWNRPSMMVSWVILYRLVNEIPVYRSQYAHNTPRKSVRYLGVSAAMMDKGKECTGIFHTTSPAAQVAHASIMTPMHVPWE